MGAMAKTSLSASVLSSARAVIAREIEGLQAVADTLGEPFVALVARVAELKGRVIVSGMGKSGHVGRKIAATLASTGTPAYFVHPSEASHGDLGMITADDLVLCLSNSGETHELRDVISYTRRFAIPLVALVRREGSLLVESADIALVLPEVPEASPIGVPTTSTTMMLAVGDALAIALLEQRGFSRDDFGVYHPGGKLGAQFIRVADVMHQAGELPLVEEGAPMPQVLLTMTEKRFGCAGVVDAQGSMVGIVTDGDLRRHMEPSLMEKTAAQVMTRQPATITPAMLAAEALGIMNGKAITCLFVLEGGKPVGILHIHDCLRAGVM
ncbi:MAG: KpsF/GutQ family sugar-phosphate isomerase [Alphaproteobacteria bacterium]|nr:KpsF/GutQ family sugar-phosphate isomerase [Alphaproteobacteria bacterium]